MTLASSLLAVIHVLAGAAWFGAMFYSVFVLHPRGRAFFDRPGDFEAFITFVSHGARYAVLAALGVLALTGAGLILVRMPSGPLPGWVLLAGAKVGLFALALGLFIVVSWCLWPARVLAAPEEVPAWQRTFRRVAWTMLVLAGLNIVLGVLAHCWREP
jgi:uncharacterized membrane protein